MPSPSRTIPEAIASVQLRVSLAARSGGRWMSGYAKVKVVSDWIYARICERIKPGSRVLDLGSGVGLLGMILEEMHQGCTIHGIEWDERKAAFSRKLVAPGSPFKMVQGDILKDPWPPADVVVLVDVLHYFPETIQKELLQRVARHLEPGGTLFLRVMNRDAKGRARLTRILERTAVALRWNRASAVHWRSLEAFQNDLITYGLRPMLCDSGSHLLDGNCLIVASKPK
jgi:SAM-dependent methyltransferase